MENLSPSEIGVLAACLIFVIKIIGEWGKALIDKVTPGTSEMSQSELRQVEYQSKMERLLSQSNDRADLQVKALEKLLEKQGATKEAVTQIHHIQEGNHRKLGEIKADTNVMSKVITHDTIKNAAERAIESKRVATKDDINGLGLAKG